MKRQLSLIVIVAAFSLQAQDLLPDLMQPTAKYNQDTAALNGQRSAALSRTRQPYLASLDAAEKAATTAAQIPAIGAIAKEREALSKDPVPPAFPAELPKSLQSPRRTYIQSSAQIAAEFTARQQRMDADYLRVLASLQAKAATNPALAGQIAAEKKRVLENALDDASKIREAHSTIATASPKTAATAPKVNPRVLDRKLAGTRWLGDGKSKIGELAFDASAARALTWKAREGPSTTTVPYTIADDGTIHFNIGPDEQVLTIAADFKTFKKNDSTFTRK